MNVYCLDNKDGGSSKNISGQLDYIKKISESTTIKVNDLTGISEPSNCPTKTCIGKQKLNPSTCNCVCSQGCFSPNTYDWKFCTCVNYPQVTDLQKCSADLSKASIAIAAQNDDAQIETKQINAIDKAREAHTIIINDIQYHIDTIDMAKVNATLATMLKECKALLNETLTIVNEHNPCPNLKPPCNSPSMPVKNCTCCNDPAIGEYLQAFESFKTLEAKVKSYNGKGSTDELKAYDAKVDALRANLSEVYNYLFEHACSGNGNGNGNGDGTDISKKIALLTTLIGTTGQDFNNWVTKQNAVKPCTATCKPTEVLGQKECKCFNYPSCVDAMKDPNLQTEAEINALNTTQENKVKLLKNR